MKKRLLIILAILLIGVSAKIQAYNFTAESNGQTLYYKITSATSPYTVEVTFQLNEHPYYSAYPVGAITIPETVTYNSNTYTVTAIGNNAFFGCSGLTSIVIPNSVTSIGMWSFRDCSGLASITIPNSLTTINQDAFLNCSSITTLTIPNSVTLIEQGAFENCSSLTSVNLPNAITSLNYATFSGCTSLTSIIIPNSVTSIRKNAFMNCSSLTSITLPNAITSLEEYTFEGCSNLSSIILPNTLSSIGSAAFGACSGLTSITSNAINPPNSMWNSFYQVPKTIPVNVPCESIAAYQAADYWNEFINIQCTSGLNDILSAETQTKLYPNPTTGSAILEVEGLTKSTDVFVYDITGRKVKTYNLNANQTELNIDLTNFAKGIYQVKVLNQTKKLIIN